MGSIQYSENLDYPIITPDNTTVYPKDNNSGKKACWRWSKTKLKWGIENDFVVIKKDNKNIWTVYTKQYLNCDNDGNLIERTQRPFGIIDTFSSTQATKLLDTLGLATVFHYSKPFELISYLIERIVKPRDESIILDFFAGGGTTGHAVMQLNAKDGGNRKFILCQLDEPIKKDKPAYKFCIDNNLPPVVSSVTIERLKRAGEKILKELKYGKEKTGLFSEQTRDNLDIGFKVFDSVEEPKLEVDNRGQISIVSNENDTLSRIYNMIFTVGLDDPSQFPEEVLPNCIYRIGNNYYLTNSEKISADNYVNEIKNSLDKATKGQVFIDGWTASMNDILQSYKEDVKIVF